MAEQLDVGFTRVANEILDEICQYKLNGAQLRIIVKIWRLTYGYRRKDHEFSISFLQQTTGLSDRTIKKELAYLIKEKALLVTKHETSSAPRKLSFNKKFAQWTIPKSGDPMEEQIDLFAMDEGKDRSPQEDEYRGEVSFPPEGKYPSPQIDVLGGSIVPPYKESNSLKKSIKEKEAMFDEFYEIYPRKTAKKKAESLWRTLCKKADFDPDLVIAYTRNFIETCKLLNTEMKYIPYPTTYLNQRRFDDYPTVDPEGIAESRDASDFDRDKEKLQRMMKEAEERERDGGRQTLLDHPD